MTSVVLVLFITVAIIYGSVVQRRPHKKNFPDVDDKWLVLQSLFSIAFNEHFLIHRNRVRKLTYPWFDKSILVMMKRLRNLVNSLVTKARKIYFADKLKDWKSNPQSFWKTLNLILPAKSNKSAWYRFIDRK